MKQEVDLGKTYDVGSRFDAGQQTSRKKLPYARSELHVQTVLSALCQQRSLGNDWSGTAIDKETRQWRFITDQAASTQSAHYERMVITGNAMVVRWSGRTCEIWSFGCLRVGAVL